MDSEKIQKSTTTDGKPPRSGMENALAPAPKKEDGQHEAYWILSEKERAKGFVRPVRKKYQHTVCGGITTMGDAIAETYARDPKYYGSTFCCDCGKHFLVKEFVWIEKDITTKIKVGT